MCHVILALILVASTLASTQNTYVLQTKIGRITGLLQSSGGQQGFDFAAFSSIPYAKPPTGELRFKPPQPLSQEHPDLDATVPPPTCPQLHLQAGPGQKVVGREDCLFLNVFVPTDALDNKKSLPVIIFLHGGFFTFGSSTPDLYSPDYFMLTKEVVFVTLNYRLGPLGWLSTGDDVIPGNIGLMDQNLAMRWVKANIADFAGNPDRVTLMGHSAGATAALLHMVSPRSQGLFQQVISQSGSAVKSPALHLSESPAYYASTFAQSLNCDDGEGASSKILDCLQQRSTEEIVLASNIFETFFAIPNPWKPIPDVDSSSPFLPVDPWKAFADGNFQEVPVMIGGTSDEGALVMSQLLKKPDAMEKLTENFDLLGPVLLLQVDEHAVGEEDSSTANLLRLHFLSEADANISEDNWQDISKMIGRYSFLGPIHQQVMALQDKLSEPLYYYSYRYRASHSVVELFGYDDKEKDLGVSLGDDLIVLFSQRGVEKSQLDMEVSKKLVTLWVNFAKAGTPDSMWTSISGSKETRYAVLDESPLRMELEDSFRKDMDFVTSMSTLVDTYRMADLSNHPAIKRAMNDMTKELPEETFHDEL